MSSRSEPSRRSGPIQGPLPACGSFTARTPEASFLGVPVFGRRRVPSPLHLLGAVLVASGTSSSSSRILVNDGWMQVWTGLGTTADGLFVPADW